MSAEEMTVGEMSRTVTYINRDMYIGDGPENPPVTRRLDKLEEHRDRIHRDLYDPDKGLVPVLTKFFAVLESRENQKSSTLAKYMALIAGAALLAPVVWDILKHSFGWLK